jgi:hypothetical protein
MAIKTRSAKAKGQDLQKTVCKKISELLGIPYGKDEEISSRESGQSGTDIRLSPRLRKLFPFSIECKNQQKWGIKPAIEQAKQNQYPNTYWLVVFKKTGRTKEDRIKPVVMMDLDDFFELLSKLKFKGDL